MCGILAWFINQNTTNQSTTGTYSGTDTPQSSTLPQSARELLMRRGPDSNSEKRIEFNHSGDAVLLAGYVLHMQDTIIQPLEDPKTGNVLCFNGELYGDSHGGDTKRLLEHLSSVNNHEERVQLLDDELDEGEWSLIYYSAQENSILFARDRFGRRSLVEGRFSNRPEQIVVISSVTFTWPSTLQSNNSLIWSEIPVAAMFIANADGMVRSLERRLNMYRYLPDVSKKPDSLETWKVVLEALKLAVKRRINPKTLSRSKRFAILFSGGIDSVLIAAIAHLVCEDPLMVIPLVNVSFQGEEAPDRISAREALEELKSVYPTRSWEFVPVNVSVSEVHSDQEMILHHIAPKSTVMDFNLGSVLWFASKHTPNDCRALLSGLGADELFGGYGRHRNACLRGGQEALVAELQLDLSRMWTRNLGRDDRCIAAHGRELRVPFLDRSVIQAVFESPLEDLVDFKSTGEEKEKTAGDKMVVRRIMYELGCIQSAAREKRAAQFGSRMAKLVKSGRSGKEKFDVSALVGSLNDLDN